MRTALVACGLTRFGVRRAAFRELAAEAGKAAIEDAQNLDKNEIDGLFVGSALPELFCGQGYVAPIVAEQLGLSPRAIARTELACASGQAALRAAHASLVAGMCEVALVVGVEKMNTLSKKETQDVLVRVLDAEWESPFGMSAPSFFALCAQRHAHVYGTTREQMALVSVKNHAHASENPYAHHKSRVSLDEVLQSRPVSPPLTLLECAGISDGAAAVVMTTEERARDFTDTPVFIVGHGQCSQASLSSNLPSLSEWASLEVASREAYERAGISPENIDVAEVHDCFSISEIIAYEGLGFCARGEGGRFIEEGRSHIGGEVAVNTRGGLLGAGHPLGATGVAQAAEIIAQFRGSVPRSRHVESARYALSHNLSGNGSVHSVLIYGRE